MIRPGAPNGRNSAAHLRHHKYHPSPPSSDSEPFNFFFLAPSAPSEMCSADEIFSREKLLPFGAPPHPSPKKSETHKPNGLLGDHRRGNSFDRATDRLPKEYRKLTKIPESGPEESAPRSRTRPRWYVFVFGCMRVPPAMEMRDIKTRQWRRSTRLTEPKTAEDANCWRGEWKRGCWKLLRSLSCKGVDSAVAASPMRFV